MPLGAFKAALMGTAGVSTGPSAPYVVLLSTQTASDDASISFTSGIDDTYGEYIFRFYNIHPDEDSRTLTFQCSIDSGSNYDISLTGTAIQTMHGENDTVYGPAHDIPNTGTGFFRLSDTTGNDNDQSAAGELHLFNPSSTTYVKHFIARVTCLHGSDRTSNYHTAGYFNTTDNIDAIRFQAQSGNLGTGTIKMWGVK